MAFIHLPNVNVKYERRRALHYLRCMISAYVTLLRVSLWMPQD